MYKLDKANKRILFELEKNARLSDAQIAKMINKSKDSVRYRIKQLEDEGIINGYQTWIDFTKLGYHSYKLYLRLSATPSQLQEMYKYISKEKRCFAFFTADGAWSLGLAYFAKNHHEFYEIQNDLVNKFEDLIISKTNCSMLDAIIGSKDFFEDGEPTNNILWSVPEENELDDIEKKLLTLLFKDARASLVDLATKCKTTIDKVRTRLKRLEEKKIIFGYKTVINFNKLGYEFYKSFVFVKNYNNEEEKRLFAYFKKSKNILNIVRMIGPWTLELETMVESYHDYNKIIHEIKTKFPNIILDIESAIMNKEYLFASNKLIFED